MSSHVDKHRSWRFLSLPLLALCIVACGRDPDRGRVLVLALDGMDPRTVDLLVSEGKLPNFARLRREGAYGPLTSARPLLSPVVWTTIATGKTPDQHRIGDFVAFNRKTGQPLPVTSRQRAVKALWNIASDAGRKVAVVGWWATWPAETVAGSIVSDHLCYHFLFTEAATGRGEQSGLTYPAELADRLKPLIRRPADLTPEDVEPFVTVGSEEFSRPFDFNHDLSHFKWALATAETYGAIGLRLWEEERPDLGMIYLEAPDSTSHLFGHLFRAGRLSGELAEQQQRYGQAVERMYRHVDGVVGEFLGAMDDRTTLVVLSDHGFELGVLQDDPSRTRDMRRVSERYHAMQGILYLYGKGVKAGPVRDASVLDIAPTILALSGLPPARDMPGRVLTEALRFTAPEEVETYETAPTEIADLPQDAAVDSEILEKLAALGYLDTSSPAGDRNVAAVLFEQGRYEEAAEAYANLIEERPDDATARASYGGVLGELGRYDEAIAQLDEALALEGNNPEAYHNRGVIHERKGEREAAIRDYRTVLQLRPRFEPSRRAIERLTGGAAVGAPTPRNDAQRRAFALADEAGKAARRGDYQGAIQRLDEAALLAPDAPLVYQYRANVAYLMDDREAAIAALKKGLELDPDNVLFRENLDALLRSDRPQP